MKKRENTKVLTGCFWWGVALINFKWEYVGCLVCLFCVSVLVCVLAPSGEPALLWLWSEAVPFEFQSKPCVLRTQNAFRVSELSPFGLVAACAIRQIVN